jgi:hypothetical protein
MTVEQQVLEKLRELPLQKQEEVLAYIRRKMGTTRVKMSECPYITISNH